MENTAIKVHVNADTYEIIKDIQQNLRKKEGKKTSLAEIMLRLAQEGIQSIQNEQADEQKTQNSDNSAQFEAGLVQNSERFIPESKEKNLIIRSKESKFIDELSIRQEYLKDREDEIRELETELYDEREGLINKKRQLLELEEELLKKQYRIKYNSIESEFISKVNPHIGKVDSFSENTPYKSDNSDIKNELSKLIEAHFSKAFEKFMNIKEQLSDIKRETKFENFTKYLDLLLENDKRIIQLINKGNQKSLLEQFEPILPAAMIAVNAFISNKNNRKNSKELLSEIKALMGDKADNKSTDSGGINKIASETKVSTTK